MRVVPDLHSAFFQSICLVHSDNVRLETRAVVGLETLLKHTRVRLVPEEEEKTGTDSERQWKDGSRCQETRTAACNQG